MKIKLKARLRAMHAWHKGKAEGNRKLGNVTEAQWHEWACKRISEETRQ